MNLPPIGEEMFLVCMALTVAVGVLLGFALGYSVREKKHREETAAVLRIAKRIAEANRERAPKGPYNIDLVKMEEIPKDQLFV